MEVKEIGSKYSDYVIQMRRQFHQMPELSFHEYETSKKILEELKNIGIEGRIVAGTGVLATIQGGKSGKGKCIALRSDIDALAVTEQTGAEFASRNAGVMHACGHDSHIAMILGAAKILKEMQDEVPGKIRLIFEPAEEIAQGANKMIAAGAMEGVDSVFGMHVWSDIPAGKISCEAGPRMASADFFTIEVNGKSCHGSKPDQGVDAIIAGVALVNNFQTIVSREINPIEPSVITIGEFKGGEQSNVLAGHVYMSGTTRAFSNEVREALPVKMDRVVKYTGETFRAGIKMDYRFGSSPVINDEDSSEIATGAVKKIMGADALYQYEKTPGGEDFSEYMRLAPGCFAFIGVRNEALGAVHPQHSCYYTMDESVLINGSMVAAQYVLDFLNK